MRQADTNNSIPLFQMLDHYTNEGLLRKVVSDCSNYVLWNYTDHCTYSKTWNEHTLNARGTIYEIATGKVVARAFSKFFNCEELSPEKQKEVLQAKNFQVYEKVDGSLGILAHYNNEWRISTRGSFNSDQAIRAKEILKKYDTSRLIKNVTYLVEIIYPENKIIVNYGNEEKLVYLGAFDTATGIELCGNQDIFPNPKVYEFNSIEELINTQVNLPWTDEGFVVRLNTGERIKFKSREYMKIAKIKANMSPLTFWEKMKEGDDEFRIWMESLPEELRPDAEQIWESLAVAYTNVEEDIYTLKSITFGKLFNVRTGMEKIEPTKENKKTLGLYLKANPNKYNPTLFALMDGNYPAVRDFIYKEIRPTGNIIRGIE